MEPSRRELLMAAGAMPAAVKALAPPRPGPSDVRITAIETFSVRVPHGRGSPDPMRIYRYPVTRVHTDAGVAGTAFFGVPPALLANWIAPKLKGQSVFAIDRHIHNLQAQRGESGTQAWSAVEHALWDAVGRLAGRPVAQLLGGFRDRLRVYRTAVWPGKDDQSDVAYEIQAQFARRLQQAGYTAIKVRAWRPRPLDDVDMVGVMRRAVGPDFAIMLDRTAVRPGWVWDYPTALAVARGLERHGAYWLEEPFDGNDLEAPARLAAEVDILITGGELGQSLQEFLAFLKNRTYDVVQPDARICGGILAARKISILAEAFGVPCIQHGNSGLALAGWIQAGCAMPNCDWQEIIGGPNLPDEQWEPGLRLLRTPHAFRIEKGFVLLPELAGLGLDISEDALKEYRERV